MNKIYKLLVITSLLFLSLDVYSELVIKVTQGNDKPTEIAISPIAVGEAIYDQDIGLIIESDLSRGVECLKQSHVRICLLIHLVQMMCTTVTGAF